MKNNSHTPATSDLFKTLGGAFNPANAKSQLKAIETKFKKQAKKQTT